jgi:hypothetical protein
MNWLNLNITVLDSEEFLGAEPIQRATWLCLLRYCIGQENGGRIKGAKSWTDRKWQQVVRVTGEEAAASCELWTWEGEDLVVAFYPNEKETEVRQKRETAKSNSARRNLTKKSKVGTNADVNVDVNVDTNTDVDVDSSEGSTLMHSPEAEGEGKGIGSGRELEVEGNGNASPSPARSAASRVEPIVDDCVLHAQSHLRTNPDFAASVGRQFHALFARKNWRTCSGEDLLQGAAWKYRLNQMVEEESRKDLAKHPHAATSLRGRSEGRGW